MDKKVEVILQKTAEYVAQSQIELDMHTEDNARFDKKAAEAVAVLAHRGLVDRDKQDVLLNKLAEDRTVIFGLLDNLAKNVGADSLGGASEITKTAKDENVCPFEREFLDTGASIDNGMID